MSNGTGVPTWSRSDLILASFKSMALLNRAAQYRLAQPPLTIRLQDLEFESKARSAGGRHDLYSGAVEESNVESER